MSLNLYDCYLEGDVHEFEKQAVSLNSQHWRAQMLLLADSARISQYRTLPKAADVSWRNLCHPVEMAIVLPLLPKGTPAALEYATRKGFVRSVKFQNPGFAPAQRNIGHSRRDGRLVVRSSSGMAPNENDFDLSK